MVFKFNKKKFKIKWYVNEAQNSIVHEMLASLPALKTGQGFHRVPGYFPQTRPAARLKSIGRVNRDVSMCTAYPRPLLLQRRDLNPRWSIAN